MALLHSIKRVPLFTYDWILKVTVIITVVMVSVYYLACEHSMETRELGHTWLCSTWCICNHKSGTGEVLAA